MSKFREIGDDNLVICPYCRDTYQPECEDYSEDERPAKCDECGKSYYLYQLFSVTHWTLPDCALNGLKHDYQLMKISDTKAHPFCSLCGKCQPHNEIRQAAQ